MCAGGQGTQPAGLSSSLLTACYARIACTCFPSIACTCFPGIASSLSQHCIVGTVRPWCMTARQALQSSMRIKLGADQTGCGLCGNRNALALARGASWSEWGTCTCLHMLAHAWSQGSGDSASLGWAPSPCPNPWRLRGQALRPHHHASRSSAGLWLLAFRRVLAYATPPASCCCCCCYSSS